MRYPREAFASYPLPPRCSDGYGGLSVPDFTGASESIGRVFLEPEVWRKAPAADAVSTGGIRKLSVAAAV
jgi:hypothetical protein